MANEGRRATVHNGRRGKNGNYKAKHNDRSHLPEDERPNENLIWHCLQNKYPDMTFEDVEREFYRAHFSEGLEGINNKYLKTRQKNRMKTMDEYYESSRTQPEETLNYLGNVDQEQIDKDLFSKIMVEQIKWEEETFPQVKYLNSAIHVDEAGAIHAQSRRVWIAHDENGNEIVNQGKALEEMGIEIFTYQPDDEDYEKKHGKPRYENRKVTYTHACRKHFIELAQSYGIELETETKDASEVGLSMNEYIKRQEQKKAEAKAKEILKVAAEDADTIKKNAEADARIFRSKADKAEKDRADAEQNKKRLEEKSEALTKTISEQNKKIEDLGEDIDTLTEKIKQKETELENVGIDAEAEFRKKWMQKHGKVEDAFQKSWQNKQINDARLRREQSGQVYEHSSYEKDGLSK